MSVWVFRNLWRMKEEKLKWSDFSASSGTHDSGHARAMVERIQNQELQRNIVTMWSCAEEKNENEIYTYNSVPYRSPTAEKKKGE